MGSERLRRERIADTEGGQRLANEIIDGHNEPDEAGMVTVRCECGQPTCHEPLRVPHEIYERVRSDSMHFLVFPGHEFPEAEDIVEKDPGYEIVRKHEEMRPLVERSDPRI